MPGEKAAGRNGAGGAKAPARRMYAMLEAQQQKNPDRYNEVVLNVDLVQQSLPEAIEAFFYLGSGREERRVRNAHRNFLEEFDLTAVRMPLLRLNLSSRAAEPFTCLVCS